MTKMTLSVMYKTVTDVLGCHGPVGLLMASRVEVSNPQASTSF